MSSFALLQTLTPGTLTSTKQSWVFLLSLAMTQSIFAPVFLGCERSLLICGIAHSGEWRNRFRVLKKRHSYSFSKAFDDKTTYLLFLRLLNCSDSFLLAVSVMTVSFMILLGNYCEISESTVGRFLVSHSSLMFKPEVSSISIEECLHPIIYYMDILIE